MCFEGKLELCQVWKLNSYELRFQEVSSPQVLFPIAVFSNCWLVLSRYLTEFTKPNTQTAKYLIYPAKWSTATKTTCSIIKIKLLHPMAHTSFVLPDFCLTSYALLGIMKSTLIFSMLCHNTKIVQIVENSSDCSHAQKYLQIHTHAVETFVFFIFIFHQTSQCSICTSDVFTLKMCSQNSTLKNNIAEKKATMREAALSLQPLAVSAHGWWHDQLRLLWFHLKVVVFFGHDLLYQLYLSLFLPLSFSPSLLLFLSLQCLPLVLGKKSSPVVF